jgi:ribosomal protein S18 acetylase RimI-like enzyme
MIRAKKSDKALVIDLLSAAFADNLSVNYIIKQDERSAVRIRSLMDYSFEVCHLFGEVWLSQDHKACALVLYPHQKKTTLKSVWLDLKLILGAVGIGGIKKTLERETKIKAKQPQIPMAYLWFIGVNPLYQHRSIGSDLLTKVMNKANKDGLPVYLETSTDRNLPWYEKHGFTIFDTLDLNYRLFFLTNKAVK